MQVEGISQQSPHWITARIGHVTASHAGDVTRKLKDASKEAAQKTHYRTALVLERVRGYAAHHYVTPEMQRGIDLQPMAAAAYEVAKGVLL